MPRNMLNKLLMSMIIVLFIVASVVSMISPVNIELNAAKNG